MSNFIKIRPMAAELLHADGGTDMMKLIARISQFCERAQKTPFYGLTMEERFRNTVSFYDTSS